MSGRKVRDADEARRCLDEAAASGLSRAEWAREHGIDARSLNAWRVNLDRKRHREDRHALRLIELIPAMEVAEEAPRYLVHVGEVAVEVDEGFDEVVLARLLRVVASC